jgi:hypothetical protein
MDKQDIQDIQEKNPALPVYPCKLFFYKATAFDECSYRGH